MGVQRKVVGFALLAGLVFVMCVFMLAKSVNASLIAFRTNRVGLITVWADQEFNESGGDDIARAKAMFAGWNRPEYGGLGPSAEACMALGMTRMRLINNEGADGTWTPGNYSPPPYESRSTWGLNESLHLGLKPHIIVGNQRPEFFPPNAWTWSQQIWDQYAQYCVDYVTYVVTRHGGKGFDDVSFEVANEWAFSEDAHWVLGPPPNPPGLWFHYGEERIKAYHKIYGYWQRAVDIVARRYPNKKLRIGGGNANDLWASWLIQKCREEKWRLDFASYHAYGDVPWGQIKTVAQNIRKCLNENGFNQAEVWLTEWGTHSVLHILPKEKRAFAYQPAQAVILANVILNAAAGGTDLGIHLWPRDGYSLGVGDDPFWPPDGQGVLAYDHKNKRQWAKPGYNLMRMIKMMPGKRRRVDVTGLPSDVRVWASADNWSVAVLVCNYNWDWSDWKNPVDKSQVQNIQVRVRGLRNVGTVRIQRFVIDDDHSNIGKYYSQSPDQPPADMKTDLEKVEDRVTRASGGVVTLPPVKLGRSATILWLLSLQ